MVFIGYIESETARAVLLWEHYWASPDWFPKSQIDILRTDDTPEVRIVASNWICEQKKIREFAYRSEKEISDARDRRPA